MTVNRRSKRARARRRSYDHGSAKAARYRQLRDELGPDHSDTQAAWNDRLDEVLTEERDAPARGLWWLSFTDPSIPVADPPGGPSWLGAAMVLADGPAHAISQSHLLGINPGGAVKTAGPFPLERCPVPWRLKWCNRLLSYDDVNSMPGPEGDAPGAVVFD